MDESITKTSTTQRIIIGCIAGLLFLSTIAVYALIVLGGNGNAMSDAEAQAKLQEYETTMANLETKLTDMEKQISEKYYDDFLKYRSEVKSYNATSVDNGGIKTEDLRVGDGKELVATENYSVYYIGWCADESVFGSSFDDFTNPTRIAPLTHTPESSFVAGWEEGIKGMKVGGIRTIAIPGELAYGEEREICGGMNSPLKFLVYAIPNDDEYQKLVDEYNDTYERWYALQLQETIKNSNSGATTTVESGSGDTSDDATDGGITVEEVTE